MRNRYKNRRNRVVNPPFKGKHRKTPEQAQRRHERNVILRLSKLERKAVNE